MRVEERKYTRYIAEYLRKCIEIKFNYRKNDTLDEYFMQAGELDKLSKSVPIIYVTLTTMNASTILQQDLCI